MKTKEKKVLVVDDDPVVVRLVKELLKSQGYQVETAKDGIDAMVIVKKEKPDLIVLDIMMPELNGYDVLRTLKFTDEYKEIPVLLLTAREQELDKRIGEMMGIDYLQKPVNRESFLEKINKALKA
ncbi:MAG: response regulator [Candidatus Omnitrophica bacterium]|nr:response regulator [Candidatus Omnitrophota bacterium]